MAGASREIHFEIFTRHGAKGGWKLHDVSASREDALRQAQALMADAGATGVKVVKETYEPATGDYLTLKIFEDGHNQSKVEPAAEDVPSSLPCFKPDDLYSYHARATMARLLSEYLARQKLTVTELIHRADALEKLEATGTVYQHAVQRVAVAQAATTKTGVAQIIKDLNELTTKAIGRVYRDERKGIFPKVPLEKFRDLASKLASGADGAYILNGAIARYLADAKGWDEKLVRLLAILACCGDAKSADPGCELLRGSVDAITAEVLNGSAALVDLIGAHDNLGDALSTLIHIFLGQTRGDKEPRQGVALLTKHFAGDGLPSARTAVANRIMAELKSMKKLTGDNLLDEIAMLRKVANKLVLGQGKYLSHEDLVAAFTLRSQRMVTFEALARFLEPIAFPDEKIEKLLIIEESIIGVANKRQLASVIAPIVTSPQFVNHFQDARLPIMTRLQRLAELQSRLLRAGLPDNKRRDLSDAFDKLASDLEVKSRLLETVSAKSSNPVEKAQILLKLAANKMFTEGALASKARNLIQAIVSRPDFLEAYAEQTGASVSKAREQLAQALQKAGIVTETKAAAA